jgi:hypothetical protein
MFVLKQSLAALALLLAAASAMPASLQAAAPCTPTKSEHFQLAHHHDINTGLLIVGKKIKQTKAKGLGSGCSPLWAGGSFDDSRHFRHKMYPGWLLQSMTARGLALPAGFAAVPVAAVPVPDAPLAAVPVAAVPVAAVPAAAAPPAMADMAPM